MKNIRFPILAFVFLITLFPLFVSAQTPSTKLLDRLETGFLNEIPHEKQRTVLPDSRIKNIQVFGEKSGIAYTGDALFQTIDNGETWRETILPKSLTEIISSVSFISEDKGWAILADSQNTRLKIAKTNDGGNYWIQMPVILRKDDLLEADLENTSLATFPDGLLVLVLRVPTSSNFEGNVIYYLAR